MNAIDPLASIRARGEAIRDRIHGVPDTERRHGIYHGLMKPKADDPTITLLAERGGTHGSFIDNARISQALKAAMRSAPNWDELSDVQKEGLELRATKISRFLSGNMADPKFADNLDDDIGYATLMKAPR